MLKNANTFNDWFEYLNVNPGYLRLAKTLMQIGFLCHIVACLWFLLAKINGFGPDTWVVLAGILDDNKWHQYLVSVYWVA